MKELSFVLGNEKIVLAFLKARYPLYHLSNVFFRDIQYGVQTLLQRRGMKVGYAKAEKIARMFVDHLERNKTLSPIDSQAWVLHYPEFRTASAKPAGPAKGVAPSPPASGARPSAGPPSRPAAAGQVGTRTPLPPLGRPASSVIPAASTSVGEGATAQGETPAAGTNT